MQIELESSLQRWVEAAILDPQQALQLREFEAARAPRHRARLPIVMGLAFGGLMLAAGVLLFVSAHWEEMSPAQRMTLLVSAVGAFHVVAAICAERFHAMAITLHAVGTVALGGAIFLAGQIFNMQEHWPTGILLWAVGAVVGWALLGDWPQMALAAMLIPFWVIGEWTEAAAHLSYAWQIAAAGTLLLAICYLTAPRRSLTWIGGIGLFPAVFTVVLGSWHRQASMMDSRLALLGWAGAILIPLAVAYACRGKQFWINGVAAVWVVIFTWIAQGPVDEWLYLWCAIGAAGLVAWGIHEQRAERINLGMAGFALTILFFFFSSVMDRLGRSASLMALGIVFLAGGWYWEKLRRRLIERIHSGETK
jgi:uncharacterized membrane protein